MTALRSASAVAAAVLMAVPTAGAAAAAPAGGQDTKAVTYQGRVFHVPAAWPVVDLGVDPQACVRFDQHTVYLGHPGEQQVCPPRLIGRTEALLVEPAATATPDREGSNPVAHTLRANDGVVAVTGTYDTDQPSVRRIITGAGLTPEPTRHPASAPGGPGTAPAPGSAPRSGTAAAAAAPSEPASTAPAAAAVPASATNYTGKGFDACTAPSGAAMNAWMASSPYRAVGIYIGGAKRACAQPNLTASWVQQQQAGGWAFMPLYVGTQASKIASPAAEGASAADDAVSQAQSLGFGPGTILYYDMEAYAPQYSGAVLGFLTAWTYELHAWGYNSGVYSSSSSGMKDLAANAGNSAYAMPDAVFSANWNGREDTDDPAIPAGYWGDHQRAHQYASPQAPETWGGFSIGIDQDVLDIRLGSAPAGQSSGFYLGVRQSSGNWPGFSPLAGAAGVFRGSEAAAAGLPGGSSQELGIGLDSQLYHGVRAANGGWSGFAALPGIGTPTMAAQRAGIAGLPDGSSQVVAIGNDGMVYHQARFADGSWSGFAALPGIGTPTMAAGDVAIAGLPDGSAQVVAIGNDGIVYHQARFANGNWSGFAAIPGVNSPRMAATRVAVAGLPDGSSQILALGNDGIVYHQARFANGSWSGFAAIPGVGTPTMAARTVGIAGLPDGSSQVVAIGNDGMVYHQARFANGTWSGFAAVQGPYGASTFPAQRAAIAGLPDGSSQLLVARG
ncbi:glycoside hydrolase domain-containing protein [Streptomyces sp. NRRL S-350]|uniref:glycoside hydrolase domain-containing protein n=1 Tax=Streptomyces sp. NRRL S-350 TaxID=1463902 RepID=UPI00068AFB84|nr:glycoside hydrolase domain-containing protein [Streptomyces sp. NRRL S-350]